jgi:hypothetical protein
LKEKGQIGMVITFKKGMKKNLQSGCGQKWYQAFKRDKYSWHRSSPQSRVSKNII